MLTWKHIFGVVAFLNRYLFIGFLPSSGSWGSSQVCDMWDWQDVLWKTFSHTVLRFVFLPFFLFSYSTRSISGGMEKRFYKTDSSGPWAAFEAVVNYNTNLHLCLLCVLLGNHFVGTTTVSEELHCLVEEYCFLLITLHFICSVLFCETLLRIWYNRFIKAISPVKPWFIVNL